MNGCAGRVPRFGHIEKVPAKLSEQRGCPLLECRGEILLPGSGYTGDFGKRNNQKKISRMAFYYHFQDLYDLTEWILIEDARKALNEKKDYAHWKEGLSNIFEAVYINKPFILNVYHDISRDKIEKILFKLVHELIESVVEERSKDIFILNQQKDFIAHFYKYGFVGVMLDWIDSGMDEDYRKPSRR